MKKIFMAGFPILLALLVCGPTTSFAETYFSGSDPSVVKIRLIVREQLLQEFHENFPNAEKVSWEELDNRYVVSFVDHGIACRITYKNNGDFSSSLRNYSKRDLPYYLVSSLKKKYSGQKIFGVTEITTTSDIVYFVKLEGPKNWITVRLDSEGDWYVVESYGKAL
jgi:hypothetical protein